jgi:Ca2+-binding EF-hand superfamily protein
MKAITLKAALASALAAAVFGVSVPALADSSPEDLARFVTVCDFNKDGMLSRVEVMERAKAGLEKMADAKGMVDSKKFTQFLLDLQKSDGGPNNYMMSKADMMKKIETAFTKADTAKKGMLDQKQLQVFLTELMKSAG